MKLGPDNLRLPASPCVVAALMLLGGCHSFQRQSDEQLQAARQMALRGVAAWEQGEAEQAEELFQGALENCPVEERAHRYYGELLWKRGDRRMALMHMERAAELSDDAADIVVRVGQMRAGQGELADALRWADRAIAQNDLDASAWALRSEILFQQGRFSEALVSCHRALNQNPKDLAVELRTASIYQELSRPRRALSTLDEIAARYPMSQVPLEVVDKQSAALYALGRWTAAERRLASAAERDPTADRLCRLSQLQRSSGRRQQALATIEQALVLYPNDPEANSIHAQMTSRVVQVSGQHQ